MTKDVTVGDKKKELTHSNSQLLLISALSNLLFNCLIIKSDITIVVHYILPRFLNALFSCLTNCNQTDHFFPEILCQSLSHFSHGIVTRSEGNTNRNGATLTYECDDGYELHGEANIRCVLGQWSSEQPVCKGLFCAVHEN